MEEQKNLRETEEVMGAPVGTAEPVLEKMDRDSIGPVVRMVLERHTAPWLTSVDENGEVAYTAEMVLKNNRTSARKEIKVEVKGKPAEVLDAIKEQIESQIADLPQDEDFSIEKIQPLYYRLNEAGEEETGTAAGPAIYSKI